MLRKCRSSVAGAVRTGLCMLLVLGIGACVPSAGMPQVESLSGPLDAPAGQATSAGQTSSAGQATSAGMPAADGQVAAPDGGVPTIPTSSGAAAPLSSGSQRIVTVGDSLTEGDGDEGGGGFPARVLVQVQQSRPESTLLNLGRSGWSSEQLINGAYGNPNQLDAAVAAQPTIACVWIGSNDLWFLYAYGGGAGVDDELESADLAAYTANIDTILGKLTATGARVYVALLDDQSKRPVSVKGVVFPTMTAVELAEMSAQVVRYNNAIIAAAQRYNATVVDFYHTTIFVTPATLADDDVHPNPAGYDQIASMWFAAIEPALR